MKKKLLQKISKLCCLCLDDKECVRFLKHLINKDYNSARIYLDKIISTIEWQLAFDEDDEELKLQLKHSNELIDLVIGLTINEGDKKKEQVRTIT